MTDEQIEMELNGTINGVDMVKDIAEFHEKFRLQYNGQPRALPRDIRGFRQRFMNEELQEYIEASLNVELAIKAGDDAETTHFLEQQLDALVDLVYVALGTSHLHGFDFETAWYRVHQANMAKVRAEDAGESKRGSHYDVVKPKGWLPPSHKDLVENHAHRQTELPL